MCKLGSEFYVQCFLALTKATNNGTGNIINDTCSQLSSGFHNKKFFELHISTPHVSFRTLPSLLPGKFNQVIGRMIEKHVQSIFVEYLAKMLCKQHSLETNSKNILVLSKVKFTGCAITVEYLLLYFLYSCILFFT